MSKRKNKCTFEGQDYRLIENGVYEASYEHYETSRNFSIKHTEYKKAKGGKLYIWLNLDPYNHKQRTPNEKTSIVHCIQLQIG
ncbi:MAG: hypothetical protein CM1200mP40_26730 [Gammaproteobacteria bacterium]|nr:MAG: hypothetical protein CM1200mP40_26730 [Gammaproteobacteria bacterium]